MSSFLQGATEAVERAYCQAMQGLNNYQSFWSSVGGTPPRGNNRLPCNEDAPEPDFPPPFVGGQCDGTPYRMRLRRTNPDLGFLFSHPDNDIIGPIQSATISPSGFTGETVALRTFTVVGRDGVFTASATIAVSEGQNLFVVATPTGGAPNDCGDPPGEVTPFPSDGVPVPETIIYNDNDNTTINAPVTITILPPVVGIFAPITKVFAPVRIDGPDFNFNGSLSLPDLTFEIGGGGSSNPLPGTDPKTDPDIEDEPTTVPIGPENPQTPDDDSERRIIGFHIRSTLSDPNRATQYAQGDAPTLLLPRIGSLHVRIRTRIGLGWLPPQSIQGLNAYVAIPETVFAVRGVMAEETGVQAVVIPVYESYDPTP